MYIGLFQTACGTWGLLLCSHGNAHNFDHYTRFCVDGKMLHVHEDRSPSWKNKSVCPGWRWVTVWQCV